VVIRREGWNMDALQSVRNIQRHPLLFISYLRHGCRLVADGHDGKYMVIDAAGGLAGVHRCRWLAERAARRQFGKRGIWFIFKVEVGILRKWQAFFSEHGHDVEALTAAAVLHFAEVGELAAENMASQG
jgi:hypothetical protein